MPQTPLGTDHKTKIRQALGSKHAGDDLIAIVVAKAGTLKPSTRRYMDLLCGSEQIGKRICDIIDAGTGTIKPFDRKALVIGIADEAIGLALANAINGV